MRRGVVARPSGAPGCGVVIVFGVPGKLNVNLGALVLKQNQIGRVPHSVCYQTLLISREWLQHMRGFVLWAQRAVRGNVCLSLPVPICLRSYKK